ncbi:MAG TPA: D-alanyl-D-alanine carboxypeptidase/D-alanyl-D-alanine-endopeptidase [Candidatus Angelobacter sp.]|nr:D-alanyl-D-alanine carboxypeptidase/D-alanyl-D-alanine-endopeptidase [Candidatus Angelobacter sp.]
MLLGAALTALAVGTASAASTAAGALVPAPPGVPVVVLPATDLATPSAPPVAAPALEAALAKALTSKALGTDVTVSVLDVASGAALVSRGDTRPQQPASSLKLLTAVTVLHDFGDDATLATRVVTGATPGQIVLVGGGDATLTRVPAPSRALLDGQAARPASMTALASATAAALRAQGRTSVTLRVDDTLFTGPRTAEGWPASYVATGVVSPVSALSVDSGRTSATSSSRDADPAMAAAAFFARRLAAAGITVTGTVSRGSAPASATVLAEVRSPTMADLVERMLTRSDDDLAEALAHLAGGKSGGSASFLGGVAATTGVLSALGIPIDGVSLVDGSGLSRTDHVPAITMVRTLALAATDEATTGQSAGVLWPTTSGLPVAGVTGTLTDRFAAPGTSAGRGVVRAKTGTLTGVNSLSGLVRDREGRLLAFSFIADGSPGPVAEARAALDRAATVLAAS